MSDDELRALLKTCDTKEFGDRRDEAIIRFMIETAGRLIKEHDFGTDSKAALKEYTRCEELHRTAGDRYEIVLIGSDSIDTVRLTHANYFDGSVAVSKYLVGL